MGCWNATCHMSNLPIKCSEKVVVIPIVEGYAGESTEESYKFYNYDSNSIFEPLTPPIHKVRYNDYGSIDGDDIDNNNKVVLECLKSLSFVQRVEDDECDEVDDTGYPIVKYTEQEFTFEGIEDFISKLERAECHSNYVYVKILGRKHKVNFVMYLEDIYNGLLDAWKTDFSYYNKIKQLSDYYKEQINTERIFIKSHSVEMYLYYVKWMFNLYENLEHRDEFINGIVEANCIAQILYALRRGFMCITGCGSQAENYSFYFFFNELIRKHIIEKMKDRLSDYCDDEEFNELYDLDNQAVTDDIAIEYMNKHKIPPR